MAQTKVNGAPEAGNGLGPKTTIISVTDSVNAIAAADLDSIINYLTTEHGVAGAGDSAFTVAGIDGDAGTDQVIHLAIQGTGSLTVGDADMGIANTTVAVVCTFVN
jgi:hypothetical protein